MPTYGYKCDKCGLEFEVHQSILAKPLTVCPRETCTQKQWGKGRVKRQIVGGGGLIFKGSGFYTTDYRSDNYKQSAKNDNPPAKAPAADAKSPATDSKSPAAEGKSPAPVAKAPVAEAKPAPKADKK